MKDDGYDVPGGYAGTRVLTGVGPGTQFGYPPPDTLTHEFLHCVEYIHHLDSSSLMLRTRNI